MDKRLERRRHDYLRTANGRMLGRPVIGKHLLSGFIVCECGGRFEAVRGYYMCSTRRRKGPDVCPSEFALPVEAIERVFLDCLEQVVFSQTFIDRVVSAVYANNPDAEREALVEERKRLAAEITNLTVVAAAGGMEVQELVDQLTTRQRKLKALDAQLAKPVVIPDREMLRAALELRRRDWRKILRSPAHLQQARLILQHLIDLPIKIHNDPVPAYIKKSVANHKRTGKWSTQTRPGGLLVGLIQNVASPTAPDHEWMAKFEGFSRARAA